MRVSAPQCVAEITAVSRVPTSSVFRVDVAAGSVTRSLYLTADVLTSPARFARELMRDLGWVPEPCQQTRHGGWPLGRWYSLIASRMTSQNKKRDGRANVRPAKNRSH